MSEPVAVLTADWHLARAAWAKHPTLAGDAYYSAEQIVDYALAYRLPIVAAGDLVDTDRPDSDTVWNSYRLVGLSEGKRSAFYFVCGQHERTKSHQWFSLHPWATYVDRKSFKLGPFNAYGLDYRRSDEALEAFKEIPQDTDILCTHLVWRDFMGLHGEVSAADVPYVKMIFTGDYHVCAEKVVIGASGQQVRLVSPGSTCMQSISEPAGKYFFVLMDDMTLQRVPLRVRSVCRLTLGYDVDWQKEADAFEAASAGWSTIDYPEHIRKPIVEITYPENLANAHKHIGDIFGNRAFIFPKVSAAESGDDYWAPAEDPGSTSDMRECLTEFCAPDSAEHGGVVRLLDSSDPRSELREMEGAYLDG